MAVFSTNQNRQFYVVKDLQDTAADVAAEGDIAVASIGEGNDKELYFVYKGKGDVLKSDRIPVKNFDYLKVAPATSMVIPLKSLKVTLDSAYLVDSKPIVGEDYVLRVVFRQFYGMGDQDQYIKDAVVHVTSGMTTAQFYQKMVDSLNLAFSREIDATKTSNPYLAFSVNNGIIITEKEQDWTPGIGKFERLYFDIFPTTVLFGREDVIWAAQDSTTGNYYADVTPSSPVVGTTGIGNGKRIADLEWFCMGERGDQYRLNGWPNYIPTQYMVDPSKQYDVVELHYAFTDTGVNSYRSEKDITLVVATDASTSATAIEAKIKEVLEGSSDSSDDEEDDDNP